MIKFMTKLLTQNITNVNILQKKKYRYSNFIIIICGIIIRKIIDIPF